jgi:GH15 family glucan-1,4-alpha-glucosidase
MYGIRGERRLTEFELDELPGYEGSKPVRVGNAASEQFQLDVYGEVMGVAFIGVEALGRIEPRLWPRWRTVVELGRDGFVSRYSTAETDDGLPGDEGQFLACSFWLVSALALNGRIDEARALFERLLGLSNDLGLLSEEYDVPRSRQVGNFPQAFSHLTLIVAARAIAAADEGARRG